MNRPGTTTRKTASACWLIWARTANPVMLTSDIHSNWAIDIKADPANADSQTIGSEFLATSLASGWPPPLDNPMKDNHGGQPACAPL